jgi:hypothetical protein
VLTIHKVDRAAGIKKHRHQMIIRAGNRNLYSAFGGEWNLGLFWGERAHLDHETVMLRIHHYLRRKKREPCSVRTWPLTTPEVVKGRAAWEDLLGTSGPVDKLSSAWLSSSARLRPFLKRSWWLIFKNMDIYYTSPHPC